MADRGAAISVAGRRGGALPADGVRRGRGNDEPTRCGWSLICRRRRAAVRRGQLPRRSEANVAVSASYHLYRRDAVLPGAGGRTPAGPREPTTPTWTANATSSSSSRISRITTSATRSPAAPGRAGPRVRWRSWGAGRILLGQGPPLLSLDPRTTIRPSSRTTSTRDRGGLGQGGRAGRDERCPARPRRRSRPSFAAIRACRSGSTANTGRSSRRLPDGNLLSASSDGDASGDRSWQGNAARQEPMTSPTSSHSIAAGRPAGNIGALSSHAGTPG